MQVAPAIRDVQLRAVPVTLVVQLRVIPATAAATIGQVGVMAPQPWGLLLRQGPMATITTAAITTPTATTFAPGNIRISSAEIERDRTAAAKVAVASSAVWPRRLVLATKQTLGPNLQDVLANRFAVVQ